MMQQYIALYYTDRERFNALLNSDNGDVSYIAQAALNAIHQQLVLPPGAPRKAFRLPSESTRLSGVVRQLF